MLRGGGGEYQIASWECWRQIFNSTASSAKLQTITTTFDNLGRRKKIKEDKDVALLLLQRSKEQEEQEAEKHPRWEGGGKTGILTNAQSTAILTRKGEKWKKWVLRLGNENRCISAPNILYPLIKPLSTSVHRGFLSKCSLIFCSFCKRISLS